MPKRNLPPRGAADPQLPVPDVNHLLDILPWGVLVLDARGTVLKINQQAAAWWGLPSEAVQGQPLAQVPAADLPPALYEALHHLGPGAANSAHEFFLPRSKQWLVMSSRAQSEYVVVYWQDITPQKQRELQYQTLADTISDPLTRWDQDLRLVYANQAFGEKSRQPLPALLGKTIQEMGQPEAIGGPWMATLRLVLQTGQPQEHYTNWTSSRGERHYYSYLVPELRDGQVLTVLALTRDLNPLVEAQATKAASEALLRAAEQAAHTGSYQLSLATGELRFSDGMYRLFGEEPGTVTPTLAFIDSRSHPADAGAVQQVLEQAVAGQQSYHYRRRIYLPSGQMRLLEARGSVISNAAGEPVDLLGLVQDVTEREQAEQEHRHSLLAVQEEERQRIAESLRNGLGQLLFATKLQLEQVSPASPTSANPEAHRLLAEAIRQSRALSHELAPTPLPEYGLEVVLHDLCRSTRQLRWQCHVELDEARPLPPAVQLALYRLAQELVANVREHAQASEATLELEVLPEWVVLRVEDNGQGFAPATTPQGLGLRMLASRAALLGGTVELDTAPGQATQVLVRFPLTFLPAS